MLGPSLTFSSSRYVFHCFNTFHNDILSFNHSHSFDHLFTLQETSVYEGLDRSFPVGYKPEHFTTDHSGKLKVLSHLLAQIHRQGERVVLVSNYTQVNMVSDHSAPRICMKTTMISALLPLIYQCYTTYLCLFPV